MQASKTWAVELTARDVMTVNMAKGWDRSAFNKIRVSSNLTVYEPVGGFVPPKFGDPGYLIDPENWA